MTRSAIARTISASPRRRRGGADASRRPLPDVTAAYGVASYYKPATVLVALRGVLGRETFNKAYREYARRWLYKHPRRCDFFNTFEDVSGQDLSWFWRTWFFETWKLDQAIDTVAPAGDSLEMVIENRGRASCRFAGGRSPGRVAGWTR